jgi:hypothetical protein
MQTLQTLQKLYEQDFIAWCEATVTQLKAGQLHQLDIENLIEEIDSLGKRDRRDTSRRAFLTIVLFAQKWTNCYPNHIG